MKELKKKENGITLLALVVTIIILLILAAVAINLSLEDGGVLSETKHATNEWIKGEENEKDELSKLGKEMKEIREEINTKKITGYETTNTETKDAIGNKIIVPAGFKIINPEDNVTDGIIVEDVSAGNETSKGNQYVWIPVTHVDGKKINTIKDLDGNEHTIELARYIFEIGSLANNEYNGTGEINIKILDGSEISGKHIEETTDEHTSSNYKNTVAKDINKFKNSVKENGGYYFARYEGGDSTTNNERNSESSKSIIPVFKANQIVYNYISQTESASLVRNLYTNQVQNYESDLINSYAWDTAIVYIQEFSEDRSYSKQVRIQETLTKTGQATDGVKKDERCNIYDMSSNVQEWTTETELITTYPYVYRGGLYRLATYPTTFRSNVYNTRENEMGIGFRGLLYFK